MNEVAIDLENEIWKKVLLSRVLSAIPWEGRIQVLHQGHVPILLVS